MKRYLYILSFFFALLFAFAEKGMAQACSATWNLKASNAATIVGSITGSTEATGAPTFGAGVLSQTTLDATYGIWGNNWTTSNVTPVPATNTQYIQFSVAPTGVCALNLTSINFNFFNNGAVFPDYLAVYWSTSATFATSNLIIAPFSFGTSGLNNYTNNAIAASCTSGQTIYFRVYFYYSSSTATDYGITSMVLSGTTSSCCVATTVFSEAFDGAWTAPAPTYGTAWTSDQAAGSTSAWHRNDYTAIWLAGGTGTPSATGASATTYFARFHSYDITSGLTAYLSTANVDLSTYTTGSLTFYYINPSGTDVMNVYFSNNGGATWSATMGTYGVQAAWTQKTIAIPVAYQVTNFRIKFTATSDYGNDDIGLDQVLVTGCSACVPPVVAAIGGGAATVCAGSSTPAFTDATAAGVWSITNGTGSATITAGGVASGVTAGGVTVNYAVTSGGCTTTVTYALTVNPLPVVAAIGGGAATVCVGSTIAAFTDATAGGTWSITNGTGSATITAGGIATGVTAGSVTVNYAVANGCGTTTVTYALTVNACPIIMSNAGFTIASCPFTASFYDSGNSGGNYVNNENYTKTITAPAGSCLTVTFTSFTVEATYDFLKIYDGPTTGSTLIGSYTGGASPGTINSSTGSLTFKFTSDASTVSSGWAATVTCAVCPVGSIIMSNAPYTIASCPFSASFYDSGGSGANYADNESFTKTINAPAGSCLSVAFTSFSTEATYDFLYIYDGPTTGSTLIGTYNGGTSPGTVLSSTGSLTFKFTSDVSTNKSGWSATVTCAVCPVGAIIENNTAYNIASCPFSANFYDSGNSGANYSNNETFTKTITAPAGSCLTVAFTSFRTESGYDYLYIYDGPTTASTLIGTYSGVTSPGTVTGSGVSLTFKFISDGSNVFSGWAATVSCGAACAGTPAGGAAAASITSFVCGGGKSTLSLGGGAASGCGISYQWQSSPNNATWTNIAGATSSTYTATVSSTTYYRCVLTCSVGGASGASGSVLVTVSGSAANDDFVNATNIPIGTTLVGQSTNCTSLQSNESVACNVSYPAYGIEQYVVDQSVWFKFTATSTHSYVQINMTAGCFDSFGATVWNSDTGYQVNNASADYCGMISCQAMDNNTAASNPFLFDLCHLTVGKKYAIQVVNSKSGCGTDATFNILVTNANPGGTITNPCQPAGQAANYLSVPLGGSAPIAECYLNACSTAPGCPACATYTLNGAAGLNQENIVWNSYYSFTTGAGCSNDLEFQQCVLASLPNCKNGNVDWLSFQLYDATGTNCITSGDLGTPANIDAYGYLGIPGVGCTTSYILQYTSEQINCTYYQYTPFTDNYGSSVCVLPISLMRFTAAENEQGTVDLNWATASETNDNYFILERSTDAQNFTKIGKVKGAGNSTHLIEYTFTDTAVMVENVLYYRLTETDFNGTTNTFNIVEVNKTRNFSVSVYPNPSNGDFNLDFSSLAGKFIQVDLIDATGTMINSKLYMGSGGMQHQKIEPPQSGIYFLDIKINGQVVHKKIVKL